MQTELDIVTAELSLHTCLLNQMTPRLAFKAVRDNSHENETSSYFFPHFISGSKKILVLKLC